MALCKKCKRRKICSGVWLELKKEGFAPRQKDKTYYLDMSYLGNSKNPFNEFQQEVAKQLVSDKQDNFFTKLDFAEVMDKALLLREKQIIRFILSLPLSLCLEGVLRGFG